MNNRAAYALTLGLFALAAALAFTMREPASVPGRGSAAGVDAAGANAGAADAVAARIASIEARLDALERGTGAGRGGIARGDVGSRLLALEATALEEQLASSGDMPAAAADLGHDVLARVDEIEEEVAASTQHLAETMEERIEEVVEARVSEIEEKQNKKPSLDAFARVLELTDEQRRGTEREVREGQAQVRSILEVPMADGTSLMDGLVDAVAHSESKHKDSAAVWMQWFGRVTTETIPGTDETYAARIEGVKQTVRDAFRAEFTDEQYAEFEAWRMDPTEIQDIPDSPWADFGARVAERAAALGQ